MDAAALLLIALAMGLVRLGWGGRRGVAIVGWGLALLGLATLARIDGAWGIAPGGVAGMASALAGLLWSGWRTPAKAYRPAREPPSIVLPRRIGDLARRSVVFVLVVPIAFAATQWLAFALHASMRRAGMGEADAIVLMLFVQPVLWASLATWQMTRRDARRMMPPVLATALLGTVVWSVS